MPEVTLLQMLEARDKRAAKQKELLSIYQTSLVCFTMNIAGPIKNSPLIERAFFEGVRLLEEKIDQSCVRHRTVETAHTGCQAMFCITMDAQELKELCTEIEERFLLGRLFDMDVITPDGVKLSRTTERGCLVCGKPGRVCAAGRLHSVSELADTTNKIIRDYFFLADQDFFARLATQSLLDEVYTTPKPGLVDMRNNGSHSDMTLDTFIKSAHALTPYFRSCFEIGRKSSDQMPCQTFKLLRTQGLSAEQDMYRATDGVNTHKGAIYLMGILFGALGRLWSAENPIPDIPSLFSLCSDMTRDAVFEDFRTIDSSTAGGRLYQTHGLTGIRGEVANGFPSVSKHSLPIFQKKLKDGLGFREAGLVALLSLIAHVQDTTLYHRGGDEGAKFAAKEAAALLNMQNYPDLERLEKLDDDFIAKNLSPGGCADLLAVTYFLYKLSSEKNCDSL